MGRRWSDRIARRSVRIGIGSSVGRSRRAGQIMENPEVCRVAGALPDPCAFVVLQGRVLAQRKGLACFAGAAVERPTTAVTGPALAGATQVAAVERVGGRAAGDRAAVHVDANA